VGKMQRDKGASFEREIAQALGVRRNIGQTRDGGNDLDLPPFTIECKRYAKFGVKRAWIAQAVQACTPERPIPVVVVRADRDEAFVVMRFSDWQAAVVPQVSPDSTGATSHLAFASAAADATPVDPGA
jgi:hypothetical protein